MTPGRPDPDLESLLWLAFGQPVAATPVPVPAGYGKRGQGYRLEAPGVPPYVLLLRYGIPAASEALRCFTTLRALHAHNAGAPGMSARDIGVPEPYALNWTARSRRLGLLVEFAEGRGMSSDPARFFARVGRDFAARLARLHRLYWPTLPDLPAMPLRYIVTLLAQRGQVLRTPELDRILTWLMPRVEHMVEQPPRLIHGDYRLDHILAEGARVALIYGWESAVLADPRFDVGFASAALSAYGISLSDQFIAAYTAEAGPVADQELWETLSALRLLTRVAASISTLADDERARFLQHMVPMWQGVLAFVETRTGLSLLDR